MEDRLVIGIVLQELLAAAFYGYCRGFFSSSRFATRYIGYLLAFADVG